MAYVNVPKDLSKVNTKVMFNLTKRQLIGYGAEHRRQRTFAAGTVCHYQK